MKKDPSIVVSAPNIAAPNRAKAAVDPRAYLIFAVVGLALLMSSIDSTIVAVGLPTLLNDLKTNLALVGWTITGYQFAQSIIMPIAGKLSDDWGRKRIFIGAVVLFTLSSIAAGLAPNIYLLVFFRILQGIGGGTFLPSATGIVSDAFGDRRAQWVGLFGSIFPIGGIIGPNIGGFILDRPFIFGMTSWRWIFFVNVPVGILLLIFGSMVLPKADTTKKVATGRVDGVGVGLFVGAIFPSFMPLRTGLTTAWGGLLSHYLRWA